MKVRALSEADLDHVAALHASAFDRPWDCAALAGLLAGPGGFGAMADGPEGPLGFILARAVADEAEILTLAVAPAERRRGVGRALVAAVVDAARSRGARSLFLEVAEDNLAARGLYRALGFHESGRRPGYYPDADALTLRRDLA